VLSSCMTLTDISLNLHRYLGNPLPAYEQNHIIAFSVIIPMAGYELQGPVLN
jgi:hypothetical protein